MLYTTLEELSYIQSKLKQLIEKEYSQKIRIPLVLAQVEINKAVVVGIKEELKNPIEDDGGPTEEDLGNNLDILI